MGEAAAHDIGTPYGHCLALRFIQSPSNGMGKQQSVTLWPCHPHETQMTLLVLNRPSPCLCNHLVNEPVDGGDLSLSLSLPLSISLALTSK